MLNFVLIKLALVLETLAISQILVKIHTHTKILLIFHLAGVVFPIMEMFFKATYFSSPSKRKACCLRMQEVIILFGNITDLYED